LRKFNTNEATTFTNWCWVRTITSVKLGEFRELRGRKLYEFRGNLNEDRGTDERSEATRSAARRILVKRFIEEVICSTIIGSLVSSYWSQLTHLAKGNTDVDNGTFIFQTQIYAVRHACRDLHSFNKAVHGEFSE